MTTRQLARLLTPRLVLDPLPVDLARAILVGDAPRLAAVDDWPHEDSLVVMRMAVEAGWPTWLVHLRSTAAEGAAPITGSHSAGPAGGTPDGGPLGPVMGECGLKGWADGSGTVEIGYGLAASLRGRGYGTELVRAVVEWLPAVGAHRVLAEVASGNVASRRLVERLGFTVERAAAGFVYYTRATGSRAGPSPG